MRWLLGSNEGIINGVAKKKPAGPTAVFTELNEVAMPLAIGKQIKLHTRPFIIRCRCYKREVFVQLEDGTYKSELREAHMHGELRAALGPHTKIDTFEQRVMVDTLIMRLLLNEVSTNAAKYSPSQKHISAEAKLVQGKTTARLRDVPLVSAFIPLNTPENQRASCAQRRHARSPFAPRCRRRWERVAAHLGTQLQSAWFAALVASRVRTSVREGLQEEYSIGNRRPQVSEVRSLNRSDLTRFDGLRTGTIEMLSSIAPPSLPSYRQQRARTIIGQASNKSSRRSSAD